MADLDVNRDIARAKMDHDKRRELDPKKIITDEIKRGTDLRYLAMRHGVDLERLQKYRAEFERREAMKAKQDI